MKERIRSIVPRIGVYLIGVLLVSIGVVSCVRSRLGISPISSVPYVISQMTPWTLGEMTMVFHLVNSAIQYAMERRLVNVRVLLQIPVAFAFSAAIDSVQALWFLPEPTFAGSVALLALSIVSTALGMLLMLRMNLVQNPPDGTVHDIARAAGWQIGTTKVVYDACCVVLSLTIAVLSSGSFSSFGVATIASALLVGRCVNFFEHRLSAAQRRFGWSM